MSGELKPGVVIRSKALDGKRSTKRRILMDMNGVAWLVCDMKARRFSYLPKDVADEHWEVIADE